MRASAPSMEGLSIWPTWPVGAGEGVEQKVWITGSEQWGMEEIKRRTQWQSGRVSGGTRRNRV